LTEITKPLLTGLDDRERAAFMAFRASLPEDLGELGSARLAIREHLISAGFLGFGAPEEALREE
jgi:hypothetical protein